MRGPESVRIVIDGTSVGVYGPGSRFSHASFGADIEATLHQAALEQSLVFGGWTLEQLTTERRSARRSDNPPAVERRRGFALVPRRAEPDDGDR